jgi:hypothetical protein
MSVGSAHEKRLAEAVALFVEALHQAFPTVVTLPIAPYDDEDFTLEVRLPAGLDRDTVLNACLQQAWELEQRFGVVILPRVKPA